MELKERKEEIRMKIIKNLSGQAYQFRTKMLGLFLLGSIRLSTAVAKASVDTSFLKKGGDGTFDELTENVKGAGTSFYQLILTIGVIGLILSILVAGMGFLRQNANKREESKTGLIYIALGGIVIFGAMTILGILQTIGTNIGIGS